MKRNSALFLACFWLAAGSIAACGGMEDGDVEISEEEVAAPDIAIGDAFGDDIPFAEHELCADEDECDEAVVDEPSLEELAEIEGLAVEPDESSAPESTTSADGTSAESISGVTATGPTAPVAGSRMLIDSYAPFRRAASSSASRLNVAPRGGVARNSLHPNRNPLGYIPPGQTVTLVDPRVVNGYSKVRYDGVTGWVARSRMIWRDPRVSRLTLAKRSSVRNTFFKHQILRPKWNKDGPTTSGNCSPTSLAMAIAVLGAEPAGLSIEQSIHRVRSKYDAGLHERDGTTRSEIELAARRLNLNVLGLRTDVPPATGLRRLNGQLAQNRVVVMNGLPGKPGAGPTLYEQAFTRAYRRAISDGATLRHSSYNFNGGHSIFVLGRDSSGRYIVGDPISEVGFITISATEMKDYMTRFTRNRGTGIAVWK